MVRRHEEADLKACLMIQPVDGHAGDVDRVILVLPGRLDPLDVIEDGLVDLAAGEPVGAKLNMMKAPFSSRPTRRP
jgi:hypothetical protein